MNKKALILLLSTYSLQAAEQATGTKDSAQESRKGGTLLVATAADLAGLMMSGNNDNTTVLVASTSTYVQTFQKFKQLWKDNPELRLTGQTERPTQEEIDAMAHAFAGRPRLPEHSSHAYTESGPCLPTSLTTDLKSTVSREVQDPMNVSGEIVRK